MNGFVVEPGGKTAARKVGSATGYRNAVVAIDSGWWCRVRYKTPSLWRAYWLAAGVAA